MGTISGIIASLNNLGKEVWKSRSFRMIPFLFLSIPVVGCVFLGVVTLNCRKVAMYRSYLVYLENAYNNIEGTVTQYYNTNTQQFLSKWSFTNPNGSMLNRIVDIAFIIIMVVLFIVCFVLAKRYNKVCIDANGYGSKLVKKSFPIVFWTVLIACLVICTATCFDLIFNSVTVDKVLQEIKPIA